MLVAAQPILSSQEELPVDIHPLPFPSPSSPPAPSLSLLPLFFFFSFSFPLLFQKSTVVRARVRD